MRLVQTLIELVEFHQHALVVFVEVEGAFHVFKSFLLTVLLVKASQGEVAPDGRKAGVELGRQFPVLDGEVILAGCIVETPQIVRSLGSTWMVLLGDFEGDDILRTVGETVGGVFFLCQFEEVTPVAIGGEATHIIPCHWRGGTFVNGYLPNSTSLVSKTGSPIVESHFIVVLGTLAQHRFQICQHGVVLFQQIFLIAATIVEEVVPQ